MKTPQTAKFAGFFHDCCYGLVELLAHSIIDANVLCIKRGFRYAWATKLKPIDAVYAFK
jgi:hypothetical protein